MLRLEGLIYWITVISFVAILLVLQPGSALAYTMESGANSSSGAATLIGIILTLSCLLASTTDCELLPSWRRLTPNTDHLFE